MAVALACFGIAVVSASAALALWIVRSGSGGESVPIAGSGVFGGYGGFVD